MQEIQLQGGKYIVIQHDYMTKEDGYELCRLHYDGVSFMHCYDGGFVALLKKSSHEGVTVCYYRDHLKVDLYFSRDYPDGEWL